MGDEHIMFILNVLFIPVAVICIIGNVMTLLCIYRNVNLRNNTFKFIGSMAAVDLTAGLAYPVISYFSLSGSMATLSGHVCAGIAALTLFPLWASASHLLVIAVEKYIAVIYPLRYHEFVKDKYIMPVVISCWIMSICVCVLPIIWHQEEPTSCGLIQILPIGYTVGFLSVPYWLVLLSMLYCYGKIFYEIHRQERRRLANHVDDPESKESRNGEKRAAIMLSITLVAFILCYLPYSITIFEILVTGKITQLQETVSLLVGFSNGAINFVIYALTFSVIRQTLRDMLCLKSSTNAVLPMTHQ